MTFRLAILTGGRRGGAGGGTTFVTKLVDQVSVELVDDEIEIYVDPIHEITVDVITDDQLIEIYDQGVGVDVDTDNVEVEA